MNPNAIDRLHACPECDLLLGDIRVPAGCDALCPRCGCVIWEGRPDSALRGLTLSLCGLILFVPAMILPLMTMEKLGMKSAGNILQGIWSLWQGGHEPLSLLVLACAVIAPVTELSLTFLVCAYLGLHSWLKTPHKSRRRDALVRRELPRHAHLVNQMLRLNHHVREWAMLEVLMMGVLVSLVKLRDMATLVLGPGMYCFAGLLGFAVCMRWLVNEHELWQEFEDG